MDDVLPTATNGIPDFNVFGWPYTGMVTLITLLLYVVFAMRVAAARRRLHVPPPAMNGPEEFMRLFRIHANTGEFLVVFLPLLWMAALSLGGDFGDKIVAGIGIFWPVSRILYARGYLKEPGKRLPGFIMGNLVLLALLAISAVQMVRSAIVWQ